MKKILATWLAMMMLAGSALAADISEVRGFYNPDNLTGKARYYARYMPYQKIILGSYPYEQDGGRKPVVWWIINVSEDKHALMISEDILDVHQIIECESEAQSNARRFRRIKAFNESDLYTWMNGEMLDDLCSEQDFRAALVETENGYCFPLTTEQWRNHEYGFPDDNKGTVEDHPPQLLSYIREAAPTEYCKAHKLYTTWKQNPRINISHGHSPYWTATLRNYKDWEHCYKVQIVGYDGHLSWGVYTRINIGVRPSLLVDLNKINLVGGDGSSEHPWEVTLKP